MDAASWIAEVSGIPKLIVGATVVSIATTLPEMCVSVIAAVQGRSEMAAGNAIGSVSANTGFIMAISIVLLPSTIKLKDYLLKSLLMLSAVIVLCVSGFASGKVGVLSATLLLIIYAVFLCENFRGAIYSLKRGGAVSSGEKPEKTVKIVIQNILKFILGAAGIIGGANLLVDNGAKLARIMNVPESIISVSVIAIGTSLPELVTTVSAILKREPELSIGNIIGANIMDLTLILPLCAAASDGEFPLGSQSVHLDIPFCLAIAAIGILPMLAAKKFRRFQGALMIVCYIIYLLAACRIIDLSSLHFTFGF